MEAHCGLSCAGGALNAQCAFQRSAHQAHLFGLDRGHDVAHRALAGSLDLRGQQAVPAAGYDLMVERFVFISGQHTVVVKAVPAANPNSQRVLVAGLVESARQRGTPVDDHGLAVVVADTTTSDIDTITIQPARVRTTLTDYARSAVVDLSRCVFQASEEQGHVIEVGQLLDHLNAELAQRVVEVLVHDGIALTRARGQHRVDLLAHAGQRCAAGVHVVAFGANPWLYWVLVSLGHDRGGPHIES